MHVDLVSSGSAQGRHRVDTGTAKRSVQDALADQDSAGVGKGAGKGQRSLAGLVQVSEGTTQSGAGR